VFHVEHRSLPHAPLTGTSRPARRCVPWRRRARPWLPQPRGGPKPTPLVWPGSSQQRR